MTHAVALKKWSLIRIELISYYEKMSNFAALVIEQVENKPNNGYNQHYIRP